jgi:ribosomal protein L14
MLRLVRSPSPQHLDRLSSLRHQAIAQPDSERTTATKLTYYKPRLTPQSTGDRIIVVVQKQRNFGSESNAVSVSAANKVRRGDIRHAVVVRTKKKYQRKDGSVVRFDDNACVLINKGGEPIGSRLNGVVGQELREMRWSKILSLAPMHL